MIIIGVFSVILIVMVVVMTRLNRTAHQRIQCRRDAWKAEGGIGPCPGDGPYPGDLDDFYNIGILGGPHT